MKFILKMDLPGKDDAKLRMRASENKLSAKEPRNCIGNGIYYSEKTDGAVVSEDSSAAHHFSKPRKSAA